MHFVLYISFFDQHGPAGLVLGLAIAECHGVASELEASFVGSAFTKLLKSLSFKDTKSPFGVGSLAESSNQPHGIGAAGAAVPGKSTP